MREAAFIDGDPRDREPRLKFGSELRAHLVVIAAERDLLMLEIVVRVTRADGPDGSLDLDPDELLVVVDVE